MLSTSEISIETINHLGLVAGIIDDIGIEEIINEVIDIDRGFCLGRQEAPGQEAGELFFIRWLDLTHLELRIEHD